MKRVRWGWCMAWAWAAWGSAFLSGQSTALGADALKAGERIVFLGDSITQAGAAPGGYVTLVKETLAKQHAGLNVQVFGAGISGNRVPDIQQRLERDVLKHKPTVVVIYIGINDVWHWNTNKGTTKDDFEKGLHDVIGRVQKSGARAVLCTPSVIGEKAAGSNAQDKLLDEYAAISRRVAEQTRSPLLDLRKAFVDHLQQHNKEDKSAGILTTDGVHLNGAGNQFVASQVLAALGVQDKWLRHVVLIKFKGTSSKEDVQKVVDGFRALPSKISQVHGFEYGTDVSPEGRQQGFTHCFTLTYKSAADRDAYLVHEAHQDFVKIALPHIEDVLVVDYWTQK